MTATFLQRTVIFSMLTVLALGAIALTGWWHPNAPDVAMQVYLPAITLPTVIVAGLVDGINPCAFTVLRLFITAMLATLQAGPAASTRPTLNRLAHWNRHHKEWGRLVLGGGVVLMGLLILATV